MSSEALSRLYDRYRADKAFDRLRTPGIRLVPGFGSYAPLAFVVGEAPGATENVRLRPFCGASGRVLIQLMEVAGLYAQDKVVALPATMGEQAEIKLGDGVLPANAYISNVVKYRPPGNRTPSVREVHISTPYLRHEWALLGRPRLIVAVGSVANSVFGPPGRSLSAVAGAIYPMADGRTFVAPQYHPAYGLRRESIREVMEEHWTVLGEWIEKELL